MSITLRPSTAKPGDVVQAVVSRPLPTVSDDAGNTWTLVATDADTATYQATMGAAGTVEVMAAQSGAIEFADVVVAVPPPPVKPRTVGICDRAGSTPYTPGAPTVVHVLASDIAPTATSLDMGPLKAAIARAKAAGASACTLSIDGGVGESDDAKRVFGSVTLSDPQGLRPDHTTVAFWTPAYQARAKAINDAVAAVIEPDPFVREFMGWWNGAEFSPEWPIREASSPTNRAAWLKAPGYSAAVDAANVVAMPQMFAASFKATRFCTWMPMTFQWVTPAGTLDRAQGEAVNRVFLDAMLKWTPTGVLGVDNADLASYGPNRPPIYALALEYANKGLARRDQTVITDKMQGGAAGVVKFFGQANLALATADKVYAIEPPRPKTSLTAAQWKAAHDQLVAAAR